MMVVMASMMLLPVANGGDPDGGLDHCERLFLSAVISASAV
jgi:hypothetical protein